MRIAIVASLYAPYVAGGAEVVVQQQAEGLAARGHTVHVLTLGDPGSKPTQLSLSGVDVVRVPLANFYLPGTVEPGLLPRIAWHARDLSNPTMGRVARDLLKALRPDLVVCHNIYGWSVAVWPEVKALGLPLVQVLHDHYFRCLRSSMFRHERCVHACTSCSLMRAPHRLRSRLPDAAVAVSRYLMENFSEAGYFREVPLRAHIHNVSRIDTRERPASASSGSEIVFGFIGALHPIKGLDELLSAFQKRARPEWRLLIAGTGEPSYVERLHALGRDPRIRFLGRQNPAAFYEQLDVTVVPSLCNEALGNVVLESLVHGKPVIASRRGGIPKLVVDGTSGLLFDPADSASLGAVLSNFADAVHTWRDRQAMIKSAAAPVHCDRDGWITRWEDLFQHVIAHHSQHS